MSILSDKYKIPEPTIKNMIKDGVISCSWVGWEEVYKLHKEGKSVREIAAACNIGYRTVYDILNRVQK